MKNVYIDLDTPTLLSKDGLARPYMDIVLEYCYKNKVTVVLMVNGSNSDAYGTFSNRFDRASAVACRIHVKGTVLPSVPDLVISCDAEYLRKWPGLLIPQYDPSNGNEFIDLAFAGSLLETIKNKIVLNRNAPEKQIQPTKESPPTDSGEDFSNWASEIIR